MDSWDPSDTELKSRLELLNVVSQENREIRRKIGKCISQVNNLRRVIDMTVDNTVTTNFINPENPAGNTMDDTYRDKQVADLIINVDKLLASLNTTV